mgnify:CR=1 FL=1
MYHIKLLEKFDFNDIVVSIKSSDVQKMVKAYRIVADMCDYPLHLGVTEAGTHNMALVKSSIGIGSLLLDGIGDTIRVSLTENPVNEIPVAQIIADYFDSGESARAVAAIKGQHSLCPTYHYDSTTAFRVANKYYPKRR